MLQGIYLMLLLYTKPFLTWYQYSIDLIDSTQSTTCKAPPRMKQESKLSPHKPLQKYFPWSFVLCTVTEKSQGQNFNKGSYHDSAIVNDFYCVTQHIYLVMKKYRGYFYFSVNVTELFKLRCTALPKFGRGIFPHKCVQLHGTHWPNYIDASKCALN